MSTVNFANRNDFEIPPADELFGEDGETAASDAYREGAAAAAEAAEAGDEAEEGMDDDATSRTPEELIEDAREGLQQIDRDASTIFDIAGDGFRAGLLTHADLEAIAEFYETTVEKLKAGGRPTEEEGGGGDKKHPAERGGGEDYTAEEDDPDPIDAARKTLADATLVRMALEQQLKRAKKREKEAAEELRDFVGRQQELPLAASKPPDLQKKLIDDGDGDDGDGSENNSESMAVDPTAPLAAGLAPDAWRSVLITELRLKSATETKLAESGITTIGQLEELRGGAGLKSIKGVGQAKADAIEDAVIAWLSEHRDREIFAAAANIEAETPIAAGVPESPESLESPESPLSTSMPAGIADNDPDAIRAAAIEERTASLLAECSELDGPGDDLEPKCSDDRYWNGGVEAFDRSVPVRDCPIDPPGAEQDDWIRGWLTAKLDWDMRQTDQDGGQDGERVAN